MSRRVLIIDGYNVIGALSTLRPDRLDIDRDALLVRLSRYASVRGHRVVAVFDGTPGGRPGRVHPSHPGVEVRFSGREEKADPVIVRMARERRGDCAVVSDDQGVRKPCEHAGAVVLHCRELDSVLSRSEREPVPAHPPYAEAKPGGTGRPAGAAVVISEADRAAWESFAAGVEPLAAVEAAAKPPVPAPAGPATTAPVAAAPVPDPGAGDVGDDPFRPDPADPWDVPDRVVAARDEDEEPIRGGDPHRTRDQRRRDHLLQDL